MMLWQHVLLCEVMLLSVPGCGFAFCALLRANTQQSSDFSEVSVTP